MEGQTVVISMNRPEVYNALNFAAKKEIIKAVKMLRDPHDHDVLLKERLHYNLEVIMFLG